MNEITRAQAIEIKRLQKMCWKANAKARNRERNYLNCKCSKAQRTSARAHSTIALRRLVAYCWSINVDWCSVKFDENQQLIESGLYTPNDKEPVIIK